MYTLSPGSKQTAAAEGEENSPAIHIQQHDESEGSEFLDDALRMTEQAFENDSPGNDGHQ